MPGGSRSATKDGRHLTRGHPRRAPRDSRLRRGEALPFGFGDAPTSHTLSTPPVRLADDQANLRVDTLSYR